MKQFSLSLAFMTFFWPQSAGWPMIDRLRSARVAMAIKSISQILERI